MEREREKLKQTKTNAIPGSIMLRHETRKYFPHAVPRSTLSSAKQKGTNKRREISNCQIKTGEGGKKK